MTTEELQKLPPYCKSIEVAKACGYYYGCSDDDPQAMWRHRDGRNPAKIQLPDYVRDLDAMHEAQESRAIRAQGIFLFVANLVAVLRRDMANNAGTESLSREEWLGCCIFATAAQRADAFLLTVGAPPERQNNPVLPQGD